MMILKKNKGSNRETINSSKPLEYKKQYTAIKKAGNNLNFTDKLEKGKIQ